MHDDPFVIVARVERARTHATSHQRTTLTSSGTSVNGLRATTLS